MQRLLLRSVPSDLETIRRFAPRTDGLDHLPAAYTALGFNGLDAPGAFVDADLNALGVTLGRLPPGVVVGRTVQAVREIDTGHNELLGMRAGDQRTVSAQAAANAVADGLAAYA